MPNCFAKAAVSGAESCDTPTTWTFLPRNAWCSRSKNGNAIWHTGHETLKKASTTGPRWRAAARLNFPPCKSGNEISGAITPAESADSADILLEMLQQALMTQNLTGKA